MGERSLGKSVALNSLFLTDIYNENCKSSTKRIGEEISVDKIPLALNENGINLVLEVIDVPGYAAFKDNSKSWDVLSEEIDRRFELHHQNIQETNFSLSKFQILHAVFKQTFQEKLILAFLRFFDKFMKGTEREEVADTLIHACLFFISPHQRQSSVKIFRRLILLSAIFFYMKR